MKKKVYLLLIVLIFPTILHGLVISDLSLDRFNHLITLNQPVDLNRLYLWKGMIAQINPIDARHWEVVVIKSKWQGKNRLTTFKAVLMIEQKQMLQKIFNIGLYQKVIFVAQVVEIRDKIPYCLPVSLNLR